MTIDQKLIVSKFNTPYARLSITLIAKPSPLWVVNSRPTIIGTNFEQVKYSSKFNNNFKQGFLIFGGGKG